jgi:NADPH:quinone reductase-like Zn-dependent oxidoreductase
VLEANGTLVAVGSAKPGGMLSIMGSILEAAIRSRFGSKKMPFFLAKNSKEDLTLLRELIEAGTIRPVIDRTYPLSETAEAIRYLETGHARAKVVIAV